MMFLTEIKPFSPSVFRISPAPAYAHCRRFSARFYVWAVISAFIRHSIFARFEVFYREARLVSKDGKAKRPKLRFRFSIVIFFAHSCGV